MRQNTIKYFGDGQFSIGNNETAFRGGAFNNDRPPIGSLVKLENAPPSKFYLGWLREIKPGTGRFDEQFLIESVEDGALCWWSNVSLAWLPVELLDRFPEWQWTDGQFGLQKKWYNACFKTRGAWKWKPMQPEFKPDGSVILGIRPHMWFRDETKDQRRYQTFDDWTKVTREQMLEFYDGVVNEDKNGKT